MSCVPRADAVALRAARAGQYKSVIPKREAFVPKTTCGFSWLHQRTCGFSRLTRSRIGQCKSMNSKDEAFVSLKPSVTRADAVAPGVPPLPRAKCDSVGTGFAQARQGLRSLSELCSANSLPPEKKAALVFFDKPLTFKIKETAFPLT